MATVTTMDTIIIATATAIEPITIPTIITTTIMDIDIIIHQTDAVIADITAITTTMDILTPHTTTIMENDNFVNFSHE
uniref:Uncharacterized protein n=1 Tax=Panagrolaimus sp. ES5 TaxID=591445 RepID=A0AC34F4D2_9BILA